jgi:hypothetical protein
MKAIIYTQFMENYGAHDWDGQGECPQRWKAKGGECYVVDMTIEENLSDEFWKGVESCIEYKSDYEQMYITSQSIVDDIDFDESDHVDEWDSAIYCIKLSDRDELMCKQTARGHDMDATPYGVRSWSQSKDGRGETRLVKFSDMAARAAS